jgi:hypothetical protein
MTPAFKTALDSFMASAQAMIDRYMAEHFALQAKKLAIDPGGKRYLRIVERSGLKVNGELPEGASRSCWAFIDLESGDVLKPDGWKRPAKHARGNIFNPNPVEGVSPYGPHYMR